MAALDTITETVIRYVAAVAQIGADGIFYASQDASRDVLGEGEHARFSMPYSWRVLESLNGSSLFTMLHVHGEHIYFDRKATLPVAAMNWHDRLTAPSLGDALRRFKGAVAGGLNEKETLLKGPRLGRDGSSRRCDSADRGHWASSSRRAASCRSPHPTNISTRWSGGQGKPRREAPPCGLRRGGPAHPAPGRRGSPAPGRAPRRHPVDAREPRPDHEPLVHPGDGRRQHVRLAGRARRRQPHRAPAGRVVAARGRHDVAAQAQARRRLPRRRALQRGGGAVHLPAGARPGAEVAQPRQHGRDRAGGRHRRLHGEPRHAASPTRRSSTGCSTFPWCRRSTPPRRATRAWRSSRSARGPYRFVELVKDDRLVVEAFDRHWRGAPKIRRIVYKPIPEPFTRAAALRNNEVDLVTTIPPSLARELERVGGHPRPARAQQLDHLPRAQCASRSRCPTCGSARRSTTRRTSRPSSRTCSRATAEGSRGRSRRRCSGTTRASRAMRTTRREPGSFSPRRATPDGLEITLESPAGRYQGDKEIAEALGGQWQKAGFKPKVQVAEWGAYFKRYLGKQFQDAYLLGLGGPMQDGDELYNLVSSKGRGLYYKNERVDALFDLGRGTMDMSQAPPGLPRPGSRHDRRRDVGLPAPAGGHLCEPRPAELDAAPGSVDAAARGGAPVETLRVDQKQYGHGASYREACPVPAPHLPSRPITRSAP